MYVSKAITVFISLVYILFVGFEFFGDANIATQLSALIVPLIVLLYFVSAKNKTFFFSVFLLIYASTDLLFYVKSLIHYDVYYYLGNSLGVLSYLFLLITIFKFIDLKEIFKKLKLQAIVLMVLSLYVGYVLFEIVAPKMEITADYFLETAYNVILLLVLSFSLLNYLYNDNLKSLFLFFGALCIFLCEVINVAYWYIANELLLNFFAITLSAVAFVFFLLQSKLENT